MVLINSSAPKGICYIETKNLDGETNLKTKSSLKETVEMCETDGKMVKNFTNAKITCDMPNEMLYNF